MIYTVTFNLSLDYIVTVQDFMMGIVNRTSREMIFLLERESRQILSM